MRIGPLGVTDHHHVSAEPERLSSVIPYRRSCSLGLRGERASRHSLTFAHVRRPLSSHGFIGFGARADDLTLVGRQNDP